MSCYIGRTQKHCCRSSKKGIIALPLATGDTWDYSHKQSKFSLRIRKEAGNLSGDRMTKVRHSHGCGIWIKQ